MFDFLMPTTAGLLMVFGGIPPLVAAYWLRGERHKPAVRWFQWMMASGMVWSVSFGLLALTDVSEIRFAITNVLIVAIPSAAIFYFMFCYEFTFKKTPPRAVFGLFIPVGLLFVFAWSNPYSLIYTMEDPQLATEILIPANEGSIRPVITVGIGYSLVIMATGMVLGERMATTYRARKVQANTILVSGAAIGGFGMVKVLDLVPPYFDPTPIAWTVSGLLFALSIKRHQFLRISPSTQDQITDEIDDRILVLTRDNTLIDANSAAVDTFDVDLGMTEAELKRRNPVLATVVDRPSTDSVEIDHGDTTRVFDTSHSTLEYGHGAKGKIVVLRDITDRKEAEETVEETKEYYDRILRQSSDYVIISDEEARITDITQGVTRVLGFDPDTVIGTDSLSYVHPDDRQRVVSAVTEVVENPDMELQLEYRSRTADGGYRWIEARGSNHLDDPVLDGLVANVRDISERKQREQELEALTMRLELALEETDTGVWEWDLKTDEVVWDEASERLFGYELGTSPDTWGEFVRRVPDDDLTAVERAATDAIENDTRYQADFRVELPDGEQRWIQGRGVVEYDADGEPDQILGIHTDITDRKEAERAVEETKEYYRRLFEQSSDFVLVVDEDGTVEDVTQGIEHVIGHEPEELIGTDAFSYIHPDDRSEVATAMSDNIRNPEATVTVEYRSQATDGSDRWLEAKGSNHLDDPLLDGLVANVRDISERKQREQELEALTTRLELALEETDTGVWEWDLDTDELVWDEACERLFGYDPGGFPGTYEEIERRLSAEDLAGFEQAVTDAIDTDSKLQFDFSIELPDGERRWIETRGIVEYDGDGDAERMLGIKTDITDRKAAEQELEETKAYYQRILGQSSDFVLLVDESGTIVDVTPGVRHVMGYEPDEMIGTDGFEYLHPDDVDIVIETFERAVANPETELNIECRIQTPDDGFRWVEARGDIYLDDPLLEGVMVNVRNVSQRKAAQQAVEETKEYYRRLFERSMDYVTVTDAEGTIVDITHGVTHVLGHDPDEMIGTNALSYIHPDDRDEIGAMLADAVENPGTDIEIEYRARTTDGSYRWMEVRGSNQLDDPLLDGLVGYVRDITQRKERQQELATKTRRLERKNEQLERLAGIVSHDLQTPLSTAEKLTRLLRSDLDDPDSAVEQWLADLEATHKRLREFADHLPRLARESTDVDESQACELRAVAEAAWNVVGTEPLDLRIESNCTLQADPSRLQRVFENCFQNTVTHGVRAVDADAEAATTVRVGSLDNGFYIADDGPGIRPEQRDELFEYGMSTGSGSGFGLAIVRTIIEAHGWTVAVSDDDSGGACFEVDTT